MGKLWSITFAALSVVPAAAFAQQPQQPQQTRQIEKCTPGMIARGQPTPNQPRNQTIPTQFQAQPAPAQISRPQGEYDVVLDIPDLCVKKIQLIVENLQAHVALDAFIANLVTLNAGADVRIAKVDLGVYGVRAEALLLVDLDNVTYAVDRVLTFLDNNPQVVDAVVQSVRNTVGTVGSIANTALEPGGVVDQTVGIVGNTLTNVSAPGGLLSQVVNTAGQTVQRLVDTTGNILERTLDTTGRVVSTNNVGNLLRLPLVRDLGQQAGATVKQVRDASGAIIEFVTDAAGKITNVRVVQQATQRR
jgi:hypothetical protein